MPGGRELGDRERAFIAAARHKAFVLYEGVRVPHRSCGIALAETFGLPGRPYQSLRRGGITGEGACGAIRAGEMVLGELLGDPDPAGAVTPALRDAITWYQRAVRERIDIGASPDLVCNNLVRPLGEFGGRARKEFCTNMAAQAAELAAEALARFADELPEIEPPEIEPPDVHRAPARDDEASE